MPSIKKKEREIENIKHRIASFRQKMSQTKNNKQTKTKQPNKQTIKTPPAAPPPPKQPLSPPPTTTTTATTKPTINTNYDLNNLKTETKDCIRKN